MKTKRKAGLWLAATVPMVWLMACGDVTGTPLPGATATRANTTQAAPATSAPTTAATTNNPSTTQAATTVVPTPQAVTTAAPATTQTAPTTISNTTVNAVTTATRANTAPPATTLPATTANNSAPNPGQSGQTYILNEQTAYKTIQVKLGDRLLANFDASQDWTFEIEQDGKAISDPSPANKPYQASFQAVGKGSAKINALGRCRPVPGQACSNAIIALVTTVIVN